MPAAFYTSPEFLELEKERIFRREWICLGHVGEIPKSGDYFTTELVDEPLLVVRGDDNAVRVLSNVCRHRGNLVAQGAGNLRVFTCAYHAWTYARDGRLLTARLMDGVKGFDKTECRLPSFRTEIWQNFIFVNLNGKAAPLAPGLADLMPYIRNHHQEDRHLFHWTEEVWQTNWKCLTENFMESYHLSSTHPTTLHPYIPTDLTQKVPGNGAFTAYKGHYNPAAPQRGSFHPDLTPEQQRLSLLFCVFPTLVVSYAPDITIYLCLRPLTADAVAIRWGVASHDAKLSKSKQKEYVDLCNAFNVEDRIKLETLQKGLKSRFYVPGPLAPENYEGTTWDFYQFMAQRLAAESQQSARRNEEVAAQ